MKLFFKKPMQIYYDCKQKQTLGFISFCCHPPPSPQQSRVYFLFTFALNCTQDKQYQVENTRYPFPMNCMDITTFTYQLILSAKLVLKIGT